MADQGAVIRGLFDAWDRGDADAFMAALAPGVELIPTINLPIPVRGAEENVRAAFAAREQFDRLEVRLLALEPVGDGWVAKAGVAYERGSRGAAYVAWYVFSFDPTGRVASMRGFTDQSRARAAARDA